MSAGGGDRDIYLNAFIAAFRRDTGQYQGKIVWNRIANELCFSYDNRGYVILDSMFMITSDDESLLKYFLAVLNASVSRHWIKTNAATLGDGVYGAKIYIEKLPIPQITKSNQHIVDKLIALVEEILKLKANCAVLGAQSGGEESLQNPHTTQLLCHSEGAQGATEESLFDSPEILQVCHSEPLGEESLPESLVAKRDSSPAMQAQNDKIISLAGSKVCHSEGFMPEESLLSAKDSLIESLERQLLCHSKHCEELLSKTPKSTTSDSDRDSSPAMQAQNDKLTAFTKNPKSNSSALPQYDRNNTSQLESKIDNLVYQLYGLSEEEIKIIKIG